MQRYDDLAKLPITCCAFNSSGSLLAYGTGYDWAKVSAMTREVLSASGLGAMCSCMEAGSRRV